MSGSFAEELQSAAAQSSMVVAASVQRVHSKVPIVHFVESKCTKK